MNEEFSVGFPHYIQKIRHDVITSVCITVSFWSELPSQWTLDEHKEPASWRRKHLHSRACSNSVFGQLVVSMWKDLHFVFFSEAGDEVGTVCRRNMTIRRSTNSVHRSCLDITILISLDDPYKTRTAYIRRTAINRRKRGRVLGRLIEGPVNRRAG